MTFIVSLRSFARRKPKQERSIRTVEAIIQATAYLLVREGIDGLNTNRVAERAGVNIASLYQYFPNKEALVLELMRRHVREARQALLQVLVAHRGTRNVKGIVRALVDATIASHAVSPKLHAALTSYGARLGFARITSDVDEALRMEQRLWLETMPLEREDVDLVLWMTTTTVHALVHIAFLERPEDVMRPIFAEELTALVAGFLGRRRRAGRP